MSNDENSRVENILTTMLYDLDPSEIPEPQSRIEEYLVNMLNDIDPSEFPEPRTRVEQLILELAQKGGGSGGVTINSLSVTENGTYTAPSGKAYSPVTVNVPSSGGAVSFNDVVFRDYDGTIVASYSAEDFANLTEMPANPNHTSEELTAQGWNWSLADAKAYVAKYGRLELGQMYITTDGKTHIHIHLEQGRTSPMLGCCPNGTVDVDWGDGSEHDTLTGISTGTVKWTSNHAYATPGDYVIKLTVTGYMGFYGDNTSSKAPWLLRYSSSDDNRNYAYRNVIQSIAIGSNIANIVDYTFTNCYGLRSITIPDTVTGIGSNVFQNCFSLTSITIPDSVTSIGIHAFASCYGLTSITIPDSVTSIGTYAFSSCYGLTSITIPDSVTSIGSSTFQSCYGLTSITIPDSVTSIGTYAFSSCYGLISITIPDSVTSIGSSAFTNCYCLASISIPDSVTSIGSSAFSGCYSIINITISDSVTSIETYAFSSCYGLTSITIPDSVTSIGSSAFTNCYCLASISIPDSVTTIGSSAFTNCYGFAEIHFMAATPPSVASLSTFTGVPTDCIIYVPTGSLSAYTSATNYPNSNTYTYIEE